MSLPIRCNFKMKLHYWPILTTTWFILTFVISYLIAVFGSNHVYWLFPFISDNGAIPPESCIFGIFLNIGSLFMMITMYIRYKQIQFTIVNFKLLVLKKLNVASICVAILACIGLVIVANFQETVATVMHILGATLAFGLPTIYCIIQNFISMTISKLEMYPLQYKIAKSTLYLRIFIGIIILPLYITNIVLCMFAFNEFDGDSILWWTPENKGFNLRLAATFGEWIIAFNIVTYVLTFYTDFKILAFKEVTFLYKLSDLENERT